VNKSQLIFRIAIIICCIAFAHAGDNTKPAQKYKKALKQIQSGDLTVDFEALRLNCAAAKLSCEANAESKGKIDALLKGKKFDEALKEIDKALEKTFVDIDLHFFSYLANKELKNKDEAEFHKAVFNGLLDSIQKQKHGRSKKNSFIVISVQEEEAFLKYNRMRVLQQKLLNEDGHFYDEIVCADAQKDITFYFNLDIPLGNVIDLIEKNGSK
jgi:hypothetical protein